jgi:hypothetical protein
MVPVGEGGGKLAEDVLRFGSPEEFAEAVTGSDPQVKERLKREMFVKIGKDFYKWVGSVCPNSREHHIVIRGPDGRCYCPHCREVIEPEWF